MADPAGTLSQKIVVAARVDVGPLGLNRVGTPVHEECPVIPDVLWPSPGTVRHRNNNLANSHTFSSTRVLYPIYAADANGPEYCDFGGFVPYNCLGRRARSISRNCLTSWSNSSDDNWPLSAPGRSRQWNTPSRRTYR